MMHKTTAELQSRPRSTRRRHPEPGQNTSDEAPAPGEERRQSRERKKGLGLGLFQSCSGFLRLQEEIGLRQEAENNLNAFRQVRRQKGDDLTVKLR